mmetsp:Transcript_21902/g.64602  ORF Transcript_21902/g.64602 Transcript_21902/m.64602 type:complete len:270 (+) Transcript_21902:91-900(+)
MAHAEPKSDKEWKRIENRLNEILAAADLNELTTKTVRKQLEAEFSVNLAADSSKMWIKEKIGAFVERIAADTQEPPAVPKAKKRSRTEVDKSTAAANDEEIEEDPTHPPLSDEMAAVVGMKRATRFRLVKLLWVYIKKHELQDPSDKRYINCDENLQRLFGETRVSSFSMSKYLAKHLLPQDQETGAEKRPPAGPQGYKGTPELAAFVGHETNNRFEITKHLWAHIKKYNLQDPNDKRRIVCDSTLKKLFDVEEMSSFGMAKHVSKHFK